MNMLKLSKIWSLLLLVVGVLFCGCSKSNEEGGEPLVILDCYELNIDGGGGNIPLFYAVQNGSRKDKPSVKANVDWITLHELTDSKIVLAIAPSDDPAERYAIVTVSYPGMAKDVKVYVTQDKMWLNQFSFEVSDITYKSCTVKYMPVDKEISYMANVIDKEYFSHSGVDTAEAFVAAEMANYTALAAANEMTLEEVMMKISPQLIYKGDVIRKFDGMQHGSTYVVYSYGVTFNENEYTVTTPIHYTLVELPMPQMYDVSFDINYAIHNNMVNISIEPNDWDGYYSVQIAPESSLFYIPKGDMFNEVWLRGLANSFFNKGRMAMAQGLTAEGFMRGNCMRGSHSINIELEANTNYMIIVFAVRSEDEAVPVISSIPSIAYI